MAPIESQLAPAKAAIIGPSQSASPEVQLAVCQWLEDFAAAVRAVDYQRARQLFAHDVYAFGSRADVVEGIDDLMARQWQRIWPHTRGYHFDLAQVHCGGEENLAWAAVPWQSQGDCGDGTWFHRQGRATFILRHYPDGWRAVHSHHSLDPH